MSEKKNDVKWVPPSPAPKRKEIHKAQSTHDEGRSVVHTPSRPTPPTSTTTTKQSTNNVNDGNKSKGK